MNKRKSKLRLTGGLAATAGLAVLAGGWFLVLGSLGGDSRAVLAQDAAATPPLLGADAPAPATPSDNAPDFNKGADWEITADSLRAVSRGLDWLAKRQQPDGSFGFGGSYGKNVGITGLCGLAFMSDGNLPGRGRYGPVVQKALDYVMSCCSESSGLICSPEVTSGPMYGHGFATLFLAEVYGMTGDEQVREKLRLAVRLIVSTQSIQLQSKGGWRYMPVPQDADMSVTICQTMALRAARNAGIKVPKATMDAAIDYVRKSQTSDGGFSYTRGGGPMTFPCTAAAVASLYYSGVYGGKEVTAGIKRMLELKPQLDGNSQNDNMFGHFFYGHYYAVQAFFLAGGKAWQEWFPAIRNKLVRMQAADGSWQDGVGPEFATAMALIILQVPNRYLPILER